MDPVTSQRKMLQSKRERAAERTRRKVERTLRALHWISFAEKYAVLAALVGIVWVGSFYVGPLGLSALVLTFPAATWAVWNLSRSVDAARHRKAIRIRLATRAGTFFFCGIFIIFQVQWVVGCGDPAWIADHPGDAAYCSMDAAKAVIIGTACVAGLFCLLGCIGAIAEIMLYARVASLHESLDTPRGLPKVITLGTSITVEELWS